MIVIPIPLVQFHTSTALRLAIAWEIIRTDGVTFRFTNHDHELTLDDGNVYTPVGLVNDSAYEQNLNAAEQDNVQITSVISSDKITFEDLRAGLYRNATIIQKVINWQYPWLGALLRHKLFVVDVKLTGEVWEAKLEGLASKLNLRVGKRHTRKCPFDVGDADCKFALTAESGTVSTIVNQRRSFTSAALAGSQSDDFYKFGQVTFTSGDNSGLKVEVASYTDASGTVVLRKPTAFDFAVSDGFDITRGCDKTLGTCDTKFSNTINFGGKPFMPGVDATISPAL